MAATFVNKGSPTNPASDGGVFCCSQIPGIPELHPMKSFIERYRAELIVGGLVFLALLLRDLF